MLTFQNQQDHYWNDFENTAGTWPYYTTDVQKRLSTKTSGSTEETTRPDSEGSLHFVESLWASPNDEIVIKDSSLWV
jgi:predicted GIY-YIG superfamily endonuclease